MICKKCELRCSNTVTTRYSNALDVHIIIMCAFIANLLTKIGIYLGSSKSISSFSAF